MIRVPASISLRVASCHIDFTMQGNRALEDDLLRRTMAEADEFFRKDAPPQLVIMPEYAECECVREFAIKWARELGASTVCGTYEDNGRLVGTVIAPANTTQGYVAMTVEKGRLSPYDSILTRRPLQAGTPGLDLFLDVKDRDGILVNICIRVLVCYDIRFAARDLTFNDAQVVVVPMFDGNPQGAEDVGTQLAKQAYIRVLLVNRASTIIAPDVATPSLYYKASAWLMRHPRERAFLLRWFPRRFALASSAFGPLNNAFEKELRNLGATGTEISNLRLWRTSRPGITMCNYEVGQFHAPGHDTSYGAGFFYTGYERVDQRIG